MDEYELFTGMKLIKISLYFTNVNTKQKIDISGYTTTTKLAKKINLSAVSDVTGTIENNYYLTYTIPELTDEGTWQFQGEIENASGVNLKSRIISFSVKPHLQ